MSNEIPLGQVSKMLHSKTLAEICAYFTALKELHGADAIMHTERDDSYCDVSASIEIPKKSEEEACKAAEELLRRVVGDFECIDILRYDQTRILANIEQLEIEPHYVSNSFHITEERYYLDNREFVIFRNHDGAFDDVTVQEYRKRVWKYLDK